MHTGSCLCGAVKYRIDTPIHEVSHCHCSMCRKAHGAAFASFASVPRPAFHLIEGEDRIGRYASSESVTRTFCTQCGASLQFVDDRNDELGVAVGTLDTPLGQVPQEHIFVTSKADWYSIHDSYPQYSGDH